MDRRPPAEFVRVVGVATMTAADRVVGWLRETALARADRTVTVPGGVVLLHSEFPHAHDQNRMLLWSDVDACDGA